MVLLRLPNQEQKYEWDVQQYIGLKRNAYIVLVRKPE
jgi:hypothetical protein